MNKYSLVTGVGMIYVHTVPHTACPALEADPAAAGWVSLGEFKEDVKISNAQTVAKLKTKNRTATVKAVRTDEEPKIETTLAELTMENLAKVLGNSISDVAAGAGTYGYRRVKTKRGVTVVEYAFLWRGNSCYGPWPAQYYLPRGYFEGDNAFTFAQGDYSGIPVQITALEDLDAADADALGYVEEADADML